VPAGTGTGKKPGKDRDRSVDVYLETVRQRTVRDHQASKDIFPGQNVEEEIQSSVPKHHNKRHHPRKEKISASPATQEGQCGEGPGLPSVRKLLAQFEGGETVEKVSGRGTVGKLQASIARQHGAGKEPQQQDTPVQGPPKQSSPKQAAPKHGAPRHKQSASKPTQPNQGETNGVRSVSAGENLVSQEAEEEKHERVVGGAWDPMACVKALYTVEDLLEEEELSLDSQACPTIEGYMERLPAGRKKSTLWNSWKKQYFVARAGILSVFASRAQEELTDRLEMFGGTIDYMDSHMLGLQDRRGQYVVVRCASTKAAREWEAALANHTKEVYCNTFLRPAKIIPDKSSGKIVVVDLGGASIRAGICGAEPALPRLYFPSLMAASPSTSTEKYFGFDALKPEVRASCVLSNPLLPSSKVDKYSVDLVALCGLLLRVFKDLQVDPKKIELQLSVPRCFNDKTKAAIASLLFD